MHTLVIRCKNLEIILSEREKHNLICSFKILMLLNNRIVGVGELYCVGEETWMRRLLI